MTLEYNEVRLPIDNGTTPEMVVGALLHHPTVGPVFVEQVRNLCLSRGKTDLLIGLYDLGEGKQIVFAPLGLGKNTLQQTLAIFAQEAFEELKPVVWVDFVYGDSISSENIAHMEYIFLHDGVSTYIFVIERKAYDPGSKRRLGKHSADLYIVEKLHGTSTGTEYQLIDESMSVGQQEKLFARSGFKITKATIQL